MDQKNQKFERKISWMGLSRNLTKSDEKINVIKKIREMFVMPIQFHKIFMK